MEGKEGGSKKREDRERVRSSWRLLRTEMGTEGKVSAREGSEDGGVRREKAFQVHRVHGCC